MRLFELGSRPPKHAGIAKLSWVDSGQFPERNEETITLPADTDTEFFPLQGGEQFLIRYSDGRETRLYFGGTDERPFLVQVEMWGV